MAYKFIYLLIISFFTFSLYAMEKSHQKITIFDVQGEFFQEDTSVVKELFAMPYTLELHKKHDETKVYTINLATKNEIKSCHITPLLTRENFKTLCQLYKEIYKEKSCTLDGTHIAFIKTFNDLFCLADYFGSNSDFLKYLTFLGNRYHKPKDQCPLLYDSPYRYSPQELLTKSFCKRSSIFVEYKLNAGRPSFGLNLSKLNLHSQNEIHEWVSALQLTEKQCKDITILNLNNNKLKYLWVDPLIEKFDLRPCPRFKPIAKIKAKNNIIASIDTYSNTYSNYEYVTYSIHLNLAHNHITRLPRQIVISDVKFFGKFVKQKYFYFFKMLNLNDNPLSAKTRAIIRGVHSSQMHSPLSYIKYGMLLGGLMCTLAAAECSTFEFLGTHVIKSYFHINWHDIPTRYNKVFFLLKTAYYMSLLGSIPASTRIMKLRDYLVYSENKIKINKNYTAFERIEEWAAALYDLSSKTFQYSSFRLLYHIVKRIYALQPFAQGPHGIIYPYTIPTSEHKEH